MWVKSEYAGELAVLSAWVSMLVPWNVAFLTKAPVQSTVVFLRFALFEAQFRFPSEIIVGNQRADVAGVLAETYPGTHFIGDAFLALPSDAITFYESPQLQQAGLAATGAALAFLAALALSVALYTREDAVTDALDGREVQLMGALLLAGAAGTAVATAMYYAERGIVGTPIPVGVLVVGALGAVLLRTERV